MAGDGWGAGAEAGETRLWGMARPMTEATATLLMQLFGLLVLSAGAAGVVAWATARQLAPHPLVLFVDSAGAALVGPVVILLARARPRFVHGHYALIFYTLASSGAAAIAIGQYGIGPRSVVVSMLYLEIPILAVFTLRRPFAIATFVIIDILFALVAFLEPGYSFPGVQVFFFVVVLTVTGAIIGGLLSRGVEETDRLSRLRRFLPPQVADEVLASGTGGLLEPHRRRIAVLFCDLRGFTKFSSTSEPEEVVEVLDDYFNTVGSLLHEHGATVGSFAGDGIMAYFGDPVPSPNPAADAVALALDLREPMANLIESWRRRGFQLSYGIGIAFGYATLGVIGFEGRHDYTALGSVVNLAARLSDRAGGGQVLLDERTFDAVDVDVDAEPCSFELKGFADPVPAHRLLAARQVVTALDARRTQSA